MKKSEKILSALVVMALGLLFVILQGSFISILMTLAGVGLIVLGAVDIVQRNFPQAIVKIVSGVLLIIAGWAIVEAVLYILSGVLLVFGILWLYDKIKRRRKCSSLWQTIIEYAQPIICIVVGILLLFHQEEIIDVILISSGLLITLEGGMLLFQALTDED